MLVLPQNYFTREDSAVAQHRPEVSQILLKRHLTLAGGSSLVVGAIIGLLIVYQILFDHTALSLIYCVLFPMNEIQLKDCQVT